MSTLQVTNLQGVTDIQLDGQNITATAAEINQLDGVTLGNSVTLDEANSAQWNSNTPDKLLSTDQVWAAQEVVTLTDAATISVDMATGFNFEVTLGGNRTLGNPTNAKEGQRGRIKVIQDVTGNRTLSYGSNWTFASGAAYTLVSTASGGYDILQYDVISNTNILISGLGDVN